MPRRALPLNEWALDGGLDRRPARRRVSNEPGGRIAFRFHARDLNLVMGPAPRARRSRSASPSTVGRRGTRTGSTWTPTGTGSSASQRTYQLIRQPGPIADRRFEIEFLDAGVEAYCFTFG